MHHLIQASVHITMTIIDKKIYISRFFFWFVLWEVRSQEKLLEHYLQALMDEPPSLEKKKISAQSGCP